jgi:hypothetical protein
LAREFFGDDADERSALPVVSVDAPADDKARAHDRKIITGHIVEPDGAQLLARHLHRDCHAAARRAERHPPRKSRRSNSRQ